VTPSTASPNDIYNVIVNLPSGSPLATSARGVGWALETHPWSGSTELLLNPVRLILNLNRTGGQGPPFT
jgi:hypothetical protein